MLGSSGEVVVLGVALDGAEPCLVVSAAKLAAVGVRLGAVGDQFESAAQHLFLVGSGLGDLLPLGFKGRELLGELLLLLTGDVGGYGAFHRLLGPLVSVALDLVDTSFEDSLLLGGVRLGDSELVDQAVLDLSESLGLPGGLFATPDVKYSVLDAVGR